MGNTFPRRTMLNKKKFAALLLAGTMVLSLLGGCGNQEEMQSSAPQKETVQSETMADTAAQTEVDEEEMHEIVVWSPILADSAAGVDGLNEKINEISESKINTHVTVEAIEMGNYAQQISLAMSSGETVDLLVTLPGGPASFDSMLASNQLLAMTDLLDEYGQDILTSVGQYVEGTSSKGDVYGVTPYRNLASQAYITMRKDVLEDLGLLEKARNMTTMAEYEEILEAVKNSEKWSALSPVSPHNRNLLPLGQCYLNENTIADMSSYDSLGDGYKLIAVDINDPDAKVENFYKSEAYKEMWQIGVKWNAEGYMYQDIEQVGASDYIKAGTVFSYITAGEPGFEASSTALCEREMVAVKLVDMTITTGSVRKFVWVIPHTSQDPVGAMKFLNLMYSDGDVVNTFAWGVEDRDWVEVDGEAAYPEGKDASSVLYHEADFFFGNTSLITPWEGQGADYREYIEEYMTAAPVSPYLGFACDTSSIQNELAAISTVIAEYGPSVDCGFASEADYQAFIEKLDASGAQKVIDEYQRQLDEWLASK